MNYKQYFSAGLVLLLLLPALAHGDYVSYDVNKAIPDNTATGLQDTQTVSGLAGSIESLTVSLKISAISGELAYNGDLYITLQHDTGFSVLLNRIGRTALNPFGYGDNGLDITLTVGGGDIHTYQTDSPVFDMEGRLTGEWAADGRNVDPDDVLDTDPVTRALSGFTGLTANGNWTLFVADMNQNGKVKLDSWGLDIGVVPEPVSLALILMFGGGLLVARRFFSR